MQKLCMIMMTVLYAGNSVGMEQDQNNKEIEKFLFSSPERCKEIIKTNPEITRSLRYTVSDDLWTALHLAVEGDFIETVRLLLQEGASSTAVTEKQKYAPLHLSLSKEMSELLLNHGADLECKDEKGETPLFHALFYRKRNYGHLLRLKFDDDQRNQHIRYLLEKGANSNAVNNEGDSLLHRAMDTSCFFASRDPENVALLLEYFANPEYKDKDGKTPYGLAIEKLSYCEDMLKVFRKANIFFFNNKFVNKITNHPTIFELLKNDAAQFKDFVNSNPAYSELYVKEAGLVELLEMARNNNNAECKGKIIKYENGYCFNNVNYVYLEQWMGKEAIEYVQNYCDSLQK